MPIEKTAEWFKTAFPEQTDKNFHVQLGVHCEEVAEMLDEISPLDPETLLHLMTAKTALRDLSQYLKTHENAVMVHPADRVGFIDAICDQIVTATGCAVTQQMDVAGAMHEVNRSNFSKFGYAGEPLYDANGKVAKGPFYSPADLTDFV